MRGGIAMIDDQTQRTTGLRERKRRQTLERIAEAGLRLFLANGYEGTTLDAIAAAAGISRRTFFAYFRSKEEVLIASQGSGFSQALRQTMLEERRDQSPLAATHACFLKLASRYETRESIEVDKLLRSTETLRARKEASFIAMEADLFDAMRTLWPERAHHDALRLAAAVSLGALRLAIERWREVGGERPLAHYIDHSFRRLEGLLHSFNVTADGGGDEGTFTAVYSFDK